MVIGHEPRRKNGTLIREADFVRRPQSILILRRFKISEHTVFTPFNIKTRRPFGRRVLMLKGNCYFVTDKLPLLYSVILLPSGAEL